MPVDMTEIKRNSDWYYANQDSLVPKSGMWYWAKTFANPVIGRRGG